MCGIDDNGDGEYDCSGIVSLCKALHMNKKLKTLKLAENDIYDDGMRYIGDVLVANHTLTALDLHGNSAFQLLESRYVCRQPLEVKERVIVQENGSKETNDEAVSKDSPPLPSAEELPSPEDTGAFNFLRSLAENSSLQYLDLSWNDMGSHSLQLLCQSLQVNTALNYLKLEGNFITSSGAKALGDLLAVNHTLNTLICDRMGIVAEGAEYISNGLKHNKGYRMLNMKTLYYMCLD